VVDDPYAGMNFRERLEDLAEALVSRADDVLPRRRVVSMHLTPRLAAQLRALEYAQRRLTGVLWEAQPPSWDECHPQERAFLGIVPLGRAWKRVGRKKVKIRPKQRRTLPVSVRFPPDLFEEVTAYAERVGADRTHVIVECVCQTLDGDREWKREWRKRTG
jgi:hypothetical protein